MKKKLILGALLLTSLTISGCSLFTSKTSEKNSSSGDSSVSYAESSKEESTFSSSEESQSSSNSSSLKPSSSSSSSSSNAPSSSSSASSSSISSQSSAPSSSSSSSAPSSSSSSSSSSSTSSSSSSSSSASSSSSQSSSSSSSSSSASSSSSSSSSSSEPSSNGFKNISEFNSPVEIHTSSQKTYLSYQGDYATIPENQYPDGQSHQSDSLPVSISWDYVAPLGKTVSNYSVTYGQKDNLSDGYTITTTNKSADLVNPYLGANYFKLTANFTDGGKESSEIRAFNVDGTCPRNLAIEGMTNCRDMGGRNIDGGGKIKQGLVYRTSGKNQNGSLTSKTTEEMVNHLKVKTEVNVADSTSYNLSLSGTTVVDLKMDYGGSASHHFSRNAENVKNFFNLLADSSNYPVFFHCRIGTDRTGLCANLLYGLLGVELNEIYQDYLFSNFGKIGEKRYIGTKAGQDNIQNYMNEINNLSGSKFKVKVYNALLAIGVKAETLNTVISNLTDGVSLDSYKEDQIVATADKLTGNGVTVTTDSSQRDHPNYYYKLDSSSKSVSYTFNASKSYKGQVVAYLGNSDHSSSKKIGDAISCSLDATNVAIRDITYADACMGNCSNRMNYYPVILGEVDISSGSHTIKITGTSNTMNLGTICIFDAATGSSGSQGGNDNPGEHTSHSYVAQSPATNSAGKSVTTYLCDCGAKYIAINFSDYSSINGSIGSDGKIANGTVIKWDIPAKAGTVQLQFNMKASTSNHLTNNEAIFDASKYGVKINGVAQTLSLTSGQRYDAFGLSTSGQYFVFCTFEINNDQNIEVEFDHNNSGYRLIFGEQVRLNYAA